MKRLLIFICIFAAIISLCSCNSKTDIINPNVSETDSQYNFSGCYDTYFTETPYGIYFTMGSYIYLFDSDMSAHVLCSKANCKHDDGSCGGFALFAKEIFYYNKSLYVTALNPAEDVNDDSYCINEYTLQGEYVRKVADLPMSVQEIVLHRGTAYYTYYIEDTNDEDSMGIRAMAAVNIDNGKSIDLYTGNDENAIVSNIFAFGDYVYCLYMDENNMDTLIVDINTNEVITLKDVSKPFVQNDKLLFTKMTDDMKTVYCAELNGENVQKTDLSVKYDNGICCVYDDVVIETNVIEANDDSFEQKFIVYKNNEYLFEFSLDNINGKDFSKILTSKILVSSKYLVMVLPDTSIALLDKTDFEQGKIEPAIIGI